MNPCLLLDCTLRDGGYVNHWNFGKKNISNILESLMTAKLDIIECGYLNSSCLGNPDCAVFASINELEAILPSNRDGKLFACMIDFGKVSIDDIPHSNKYSIDYIRLAFHKKNYKDALVFCEQLIEKGYHVFLQPMVTPCYSDEELLSLIRSVNEINPDGFYIVDSFGSMRRDDVLRLCYLVDHNLGPGIKLGFHPHNNLQLAFSNAQAFWEFESTHDRVVDCSVYGMGRGAGNLCTELVTQHFNQSIGTQYNTISLLGMIDEVLLPIYQKTPWGYNASYYLSASKNCHPNYAINLIEKQTLRTSAIERILERIPEKKRGNFDQGLLDRLYLEYQTYHVNDQETKRILKAKINGSLVLVVAPGMTLQTHQMLIQEYCVNVQPFIIAVNFLPDFPVDLLFVSNSRRKPLLEEEGNVPLTLYTSNVLDRPENALTVNYADLLNTFPDVLDNSGLMLLSLLIRIGVKEVVLAGFDGFLPKQQDNYYKEELVQADIDSEKMMQKNEQITEQIRRYASLLKIEFLTPTAYRI